MTWSASKIFAVTIRDMCDATTALDLDGDTLKIALYDNDITPDNTVTAANSAYNAGQWTATGNEVSDGTEWDAAGEPLVSNDLTIASAVIKLDANDTVSGGSSATLASVYGGLVYSDTIASPVADQGVCYLYFGGSNSVTNGTFTVVYSASGIFTLTLT